MLKQAVFWMLLLASLKSVAVWRAEVNPQTSFGCLLDVFVYSEVGNAVLIELRQLATSTNRWGAQRDRAREILAWFESNRGNISQFVFRQLLEKFDDVGELIESLERRRQTLALADSEEIESSWATAIWSEAHERQVDVLALPLFSLNEIYLMERAGVISRLCIDRERETLSFFGNGQSHWLHLLKQNETVIAVRLNGSPS